jgi:hypothetical protein
LVTIPVGPGQLYLIDTSAHARTNPQPVRNVIAGLIADPGGSHLRDR